MSFPVWLTYGLLLAVAIPWYWDASTPPLLFGIPLWVVVSFGASSAISLLTVWLLLRHWPDDGNADPQDSIPPGDASP